MALAWCPSCLGVSPARCLGYFVIQRFEFIAACANSRQTFPPFSCFRTFAVSRFLLSRLCALGVPVQRVSDLSAQPKPPPVPECADAGCNPLAESPQIENRKSI